jgi:hypothetical protein
MMKDELREQLGSFIAADLPSSSFIAHHFSLVVCFARAMVFAKMLA